LYNLPGSLLKLLTVAVNLVDRSSLAWLKNPEKKSSSGDAAFGNKAFMATFLGRRFTRFDPK